MKELERVHVRERERERGEGEGRREGERGRETKKRMKKLEGGRLRRRERDYNKSV